MDKILSNQIYNLNKSKEDEEKPQNKTPPFNPFKNIIVKNWFESVRKYINKIILIFYIKYLIFKL